MRQKRYCACLVKISNKRKCAVTINTIRTQKEIIKRRRGANFFLQVKEKQKTSKEDIEDYLNDKEFKKKLKDKRKYKKKTQKKRGKLYTRRYIQMKQALTNITTINMAGVKRVYLLKRRKVD